MNRLSFYFDAFMTALCSECISSDNLSGTEFGVRALCSWVLDGDWFTFEPISSKFEGKEANCRCFCEEVEIITNSVSRCSDSFLRLQKSIQDIASDSDAVVVWRDYEFVTDNIPIKRYRIKFFGDNDVIFQKFN